MLGSSWVAAQLSASQEGLSCMSDYTTRRTVAGSIPDEITEFFNWHNLSSRTMVVRSTQPLTKMGTRNLPGGKGRPTHKADNLTAICESTIRLSCGTACIEGIILDSEVWNLNITCTYYEIYYWICVRFCTNSCYAQWHFKEQLMAVFNVSLNSTPVYKIKNLGSKKHVTLLNFSLVLF
jgi:hypothetical protein